MAQTFQYPNLFTADRKYGRFREIHNSTKTEVTPFLSGYAIPLKADTWYTLSAWLDRTENMSSTDVFIIDHNGTYTPVFCAVLPNIPSGGGYLSWTFKPNSNFKDTSKCFLRFDNNGSTDGKNSILRVRDVMLVEGTEPRAWAPAAGEVWP